MSETPRERAVRLIREMREHTVERGCTPAEAAGFAAKVAQWIEKYQIEEAELRATKGEKGFTEDDVEVCQNFLRTGKKVFNPGMTQVVTGLARGVCCKVILDHKGDEAVYGIIGDSIDADYVCQVALTVVPALKLSANLEGIEHGYEKAGLIRWTNEYLTGAGMEIQKRLEAERKGRSDEKAKAAVGGTALMVITGDAIATVKREVVAQAFTQLYPRTRTIKSRAQYDDTARERGREAGKRIGLNVGLEGG